MFKAFKAEQIKFQDELNDLFDRYPWRLWIVIFFGYLGCFQLGVDLVHYLRPLWQVVPRYEEYIITFFTASSMIWLRRYRRQSTPEQREAEKRILEQADEILRDARAHAGDVPL